MTDGLQSNLGPSFESAYSSARNYRWEQAATLARKVISSKTYDTSIDEAEALEFSAKCHFKAAFQSSSRERFKEFMLVAEASSKRASLLFEKALRTSFAKRSLSRSMFASYWITEDFAIRRNIIQDCISTSIRVITNFESEGNSSQLAETRKDILSYFRESLNLSSEWTTLNSQFQQALENGRKCAKEFEDLADDESLLEVLSFLVWLLAIEAQVLVSPSEFKSFEHETRRFVEHMNAIRQRVRSPLSAYLSLEAAANLAFDFDSNYDLAMNTYEKAAQAAKPVGDNLLSGRTRWLMAQVAYWSGSNMQSIDERQASLLSGIDHASASIQYFSPSKPTSDLAAAYASCADCHIEFANQVATAVDAKEEHLREAIRISTEGVQYEEDTWGWGLAAHALSKALYFLSRIAQRERRRLLLEALPIREKTVTIADRLFPSFWNAVIMRNYSALVKADLALEETDRGEKMRLLEEAIADMRTCLDLGSKWATSPGIIRRLALFSEWFGSILNEQFLLTKNPATARQAIRTLETSIDYLVRCQNVGGIGPVRWRIARVYDALAQFDLASDAFRSAADEYHNGAEKIPGLNSTYEDLALYMNAWQHAEKARLQHDAADFSQAAEEYSKSAELLQASRTWDYLAGLFAARSMLEEGESLSRREMHEEAIRCFTKAASAFKGARIQLRVRSQESKLPIEQQEIRDWLVVTEKRDDYCRCRAELEEARALDKEGRRMASARKYQIASEGFKALRESSNPQEPGELEVLICFCEAWGKMQDAEARSSPELYSEAAEAFLSFEEVDTRKQLRLLGLANSSICRALAAGTQFRQNRDIQSYSDVKKWLESAADYYREAGFGKTESWTRATQRLFDALVYLFQAETDKDPDRKTSLYHLAESQLELAAKLYDEAGFPSKKLDVLGRLEKVREERQVLVAALESLSKIPILAGSSLVPVVLSRGQPSGLERFEEAYVVGELSAPQDEILTGTTLTLEVDIANVGRTAATLLKVDGVVQEGLVFDEAKNSYKRENGSINLAGKRLDHLQTFKARVTLAAAHTGNYQLRPKIFFTDDRGNYRSYEFRPNTLKVLESGALSRSDMSTLAPMSTQVQVPEDFRFDTQRAKEVFQSLVNDFLKDYVSKKLSMDHAGWRSLMQIAREAKTPRSSFYGPQGKVGPVLAELERRGLVEVRIFSGERGRGGTVRKLRVAYDNRIVRDIVQKAVMEKS